MTTEKHSPPPMLRVGVDFGFGFTGLALMDGPRLLARAVLEHRTNKADISQLLKERRANRAMRRRARSRRKRLRDFRALLAEMNLPLVLPALAEQDKRLAGNRLYAVAHWRGWDYAELVELLMDEPEDGPPGPAAKAREIDNFLAREQNIRPVPAERLKQGDRPKASKKIPRDSEPFRRREQEWQEAGDALAAGRRPAAPLLRWVELRQSCLGGLAEIVRAARDAEVKAAENPDDEALAVRAETARAAADNLRETLDNGAPGDISDWIAERLDAVFGAGVLAGRERDDLRDEIMIRLGLDDGREKHRAGKLYAPSRNRHRQKALDELRDKMRGILADLGRADECARWFTRAAAILTRRQRPQNVSNRKPGKCRAMDETDETDEKTGKKFLVRCRRNVPRRGKPEVRRLLFETAARQMRVRPPDEADESGEEESRRLRAGELRELMAIPDFDNGKVDGERWAAFFRRLPNIAKRDEDGEELRAMRDQLRDLACNRGQGRTALCQKHMEEKLALVKRGETASARWLQLTAERLLGRADAKPALLSRVDKIRAQLARMLAAAGFPDPRAAPVVHVGVESARFDIAALSAGEGRKLKKSAYGKKRGRSRHAMAKAQNDLCIFCGEKLGADVTVDHVFARARGGGDARLNRAAMCAVCNTQKWKFNQGQLDPDALAALRENGCEKQADFLQKRAARNAPLAAEANLAAAQTTMFGAAVLRGVLGEMLVGDPAIPANAEEIRRIFPRQRAADLARVREAWFPKINRQKRALRAPTIADEKNGADLRIGDPPKQFPGVPRDPHKLPDCVQLLPDGKFQIAPAAEPGGECVATVWLKDERRETVRLKADAETELDLGGKKIYGKLVAVDGETDPAAWPVEQLSRRDGVLRLRARRDGKCELRFDGKPFRVVIRPRENDPVEKYHHAIDAVVAAAPADWATIVRQTADFRRRGERADRAFERALRNAQPRDRDGQPLSDAAPPPEDHDWLRKSHADKSGPKRAKTKREPLGFWKDRGAPDGAEILVQRQRLDRIARNDVSAIIPAAAEVRDALEQAWQAIDRLPPAERELYVNAEGTGPRRREFIAARWFLETREKAWAEVDVLPPEERKKFVRVRRDAHGRETAFIRERWFRADWDNRAVLFLDPLRVRSVPLEIRGKRAAPGAKSRRMNPRDRAFAVRRRDPAGREHLHYFNREENWGEAVLWRNPDGALDFVRRRPAFYHNRGNLPADINREWETEQRNGQWAEKKPPQDADIVDRFHRDDKVRIVGHGDKIPADESGRWRVVKLDKNGATLAALNDDARRNLPPGKAEKFKNYRALRRA